MLHHRLRAALTGAVTEIQYIGSVTKSAVNSGQWDTAGEALNVLNVAQPGDLVVIAFTFDSNFTLSWSWSGMSFTAIYNQTGTGSPGSYTGYRFIQSGDANPYISGTEAGDWENLSIVASVFRNVSSFVNSSSASGSTGMPNPPSLTAAGNLWVATGHIDDDVVTNWTAPSSYTLAASATNGTAEVASSTAIAYRIATLSTNDPAAFGGSGSDSWRAATIAFS
jgi:hypothetical protein